MRSAAPALVAALALACAAPPPAPCPGTPVATFRFERPDLPGFTGPLVPKGDARLVGLDPDPTLADCTPDPLDPNAPIRYREDLPAFDATLTTEDPSASAALCRSNGVVLSGTRTGPSSYSVEADADAAVLCNGACGAALRVIVRGDVVPGTGGATDEFHGVLVEVLTAARGSCDACLPAVPGASPPANACAARYLLAGVAR